jgi:RNA recognition motif-containing protein
MDSVILNSTALTNVANVLDLKTIVTEQYPEKLKHTIPEISDALGERSVVFPKTKFSMMTSDVLRKLDRWETAVKYENPLKNTLFVGNLNFEVTEEMLTDMFEKNYNVRSLKIPYAFDENGNRTRSKGYGLVTLDSTEELERAISEFNGNKWFGRNLIVREDGGSRVLASGQDKTTNHENEVDKVILCGIETHVCILQTCVDLRRNNFDVYLPVDAVGSQRLQDHEVAIRRLEREGVKLTTTESVVFELIKDSSHENFREISSLIKERAELISNVQDGSVQSESKQEKVVSLEDNEENIESKVLNALFSGGGKS